MTFPNEGRQKLDGTKAPFFPYAKEEITRTWMDYFINMMRQYFIQVDQFTSALIDSRGGRFLSLPSASLYDTTSQSDGVNTPNAVKFNTTVAADTLGFHVATNGSGLSRITAEQSGKYNLQFSLQLQNTDNAAHIVGIWLRKNGTNVADSCTDVTVPARKSAGVYGYAVAAWNFIVEMEEDDYIELMWAAPSTLVTIPYLPATTSPYVRPATPSAIATMTFVSRI